MLKGFVNALFPNVHTQSNYDFKAKEAKQLGGKLSQSSIKKPDNKYSEMGIGERTNKGKPVPGQGSAPNTEIGEPGEPGPMSPDQKEQLEKKDSTMSGKSKL